MADKTEVVRELYRFLRTACMNQKYYAARATVLGRWNKYADVLVAFTGSAAIGSWAIWREGFGMASWAVLAGVAAVASAVRPALKWEPELNRLGGLHVKYQGLYYDVERIVALVQRDKVIPDDLASKLDSLREKYVTIAAGDDAQPIARLLTAAQEQTYAQHPIGSLWVPPQEVTPRQE